MPPANPQSGSEQQITTTRIEPSEGASVEAVRARLDSVLPQVKQKLPGLMGTDVDPQTREVVLFVYAVGDEVQRVAAQEQELEALIGYPVRIRMQDAPTTDAGSPRLTGGRSGASSIQ